MSSTSSPAAPTLSSPASSPSPCRFSSSPAPPSPEPTTSLLPPIELDERPLHPFSGTSKSNCRPPLYEKSARVRARSPGDDSPPAPRKRPRHAPHNSVEGRVGAPTSVQISPAATPIATNRYAEEENIWNGAIASVIDDVNPVIDLSGRNLSYISPQIASLAKFVALLPSLTSSPPQRQNAFSRTTSLPHVGSPTSRVAERSLTVSSITFGAGRPQTGHGALINLFFAQNKIEVLPVELFQLANLRVLSLRHNNLTGLPPSIHHLTSLEELQIGGNRIQYLPSEILRLPLKKIGLYPNPWLPCPPLEPPLKTPRLLGSLQSNFIIPPLTEICVRILLSRPTSENLGKQKPKTYLERNVEMPLSRWGLPPKYLAILEASVPDGQPLSVCPDAVGGRRKEYNAMQDACSSLCGNQQRHREVSSCFSEPAEGRYEWVKRINEVDVGGLIPVEWRGCSYGCLEFLEEFDMGDDDDITFGQD